MAALSFDPIRWQIDTLSKKAVGLVTTKDTYTVNLTGAQTVTGIKVSGSQPPQTSRYIAFKVGGVWGRLTGTGTFSAFTQNAATPANLQTFGNVPADLTKLTNVPALAGKNIGVAFCLETQDTDNAYPTIGLSFTCKNSNQTLTHTEYSPVYELTENAQIIDITAVKTVSNGGSVDILAQATLHDGTKTSWLDIGEFSGVKAKSIQLRGDFRATKLGVSQAKITSCQILYSDGTNIMTGITDGEIYSLTQDWYMPLKQCRVTIQHSELKDSTLRAYAAFRASPKRTGVINLGIGSGGRKTFELPHKGGIRYDSFRVFYDGVETFSDWELNSEAGRLTCSAPSGVIVTCSYEYGWDIEDWQEMQLASRMDYGEYFKSEYRLSRDSADSTAGAIKLVMGKTSGRTENEALGTATGTAKSFRLSRLVRDGKISVYANGAIVAAKNWRLHEDNQHITVAAASGAAIKASYDWESETPVIYQFSTVFAE